MTKRDAELMATEHGELRSALGRLADAAENLASSEPDMPSHRETEATFDAALNTARAILAATYRPSPPPVV